MTHHEHKSPHGDAQEKKDPVCGMTVTADTPHKLEHDGKSYLFCSAGCLDKFREEPARYAA